MLEFYKTFENKTVKIDQPEYGCWINAVSPTEEEKNFLIEEMGIVPEFVKSSLDEEESSHLDYDEDNNQTLVIVDYPSAEDKADGFDTLQYTTLPLGIVIMKGYIVTISLYENYNIDDMAKGKVRGIDTNLKTRFLLLLLLRISQRYLIYLRQIDRLSSRTEHRLHKSMQNKELIQMLGLEKSLVYFSTSLKVIILYLPASRINSISLSLLILIISNNLRYVFKYIIYISINIYHMQLIFSFIVIFYWLNIS